MPRHLLVDMAIGRFFNAEAEISVSEQRAVPFGDGIDANAFLHTALAVRQKCLTRQPARRLLEALDIRPVVAPHFRGIRDLGNRTRAVGRQAPGTPQMDRERVPENRLEWIALHGAIRISRL